MSKVIVAGSLNMDVVARAKRHPVPGETLLGSTLDFFPGGKGLNQAAAAAKLGVPTQLIGKVGMDSFGDALLEFLKTLPMDLSRVTRSSKSSTGTALIVVSENSENTIVVVPGTNALLEAADAAVEFERGDVLVGQLEIPFGTLEKFFEKGKKKGAATVLNPSPAAVVGQDLLRLSDVIVLNETELGVFCGQKAETYANFKVIRKAVLGLKTRQEQAFIVTLGEKGAFAVTGEREVFVPGRKVKTVDTTGAGDCFVGALAARLSCGDRIEEAMRYANTAASLCVQRPGAAPSMPTAKEVDAVLGD